MKKLSKRPRVKLFKVVFMTDNSLEPREDYIASVAESLGGAEDLYLKESIEGTEVRQIEFLGNISIAPDVVDVIQKIIEHDAQYDHFEKVINESEPKKEESVWICQKCGTPSLNSVCANALCKSRQGTWIPFKEFQKSIVELERTVPTPMTPDSIPSPPLSQEQEAVSQASDETHRECQSSEDSQEGETPPQGS